MARGESPQPPIGEAQGFTLKAAGEGRAAFVLISHMDRHGNPMGTRHDGVRGDGADGRR